MATKRKPPSEPPPEDPAPVPGVDYIATNEVEPMPEDDGRHATDWLRGLPS